MSGRGVVVLSGEASVYTVYGVLGTVYRNV